MAAAAWPASSAGESSPSIGRVIRLRFLALLLIPLVALVAACGSSKSDSSSKGSSSQSSSGSKSGSSSASGQCSYQKDTMQAAKKVSLPPADPPSHEPASETIALSTGPVKVSLDADQAPCTVNSFVSLAKQGYFDNTKCHRLTSGNGLSVLQCGDPSATGRGGPGYQFKDELVQNDKRLQPCQDIQGQPVCTYKAGTVAMANAGPDTNGSQFFLVYKDSYLPNSYTVFGHMDAAGLKAVNKIAAGGSDPNTEAPNANAAIASVK